MSAIANGISLTWCRVTIPWRGPFIVEMSAPDAVTPAAGIVTVIMGTFTVVCSLVPARSGLFAGSWRGYAVGGMNGWDKPVEAKGYKSPFGLLSTQIFTDAALACGELPPSVLVPQVLGEFYVRAGGEPASQVFDLLDDGVDWWVAPTGITQVGTRLPGIVSADFELIDNDPSKGRATIATDALEAFTPGVTFIDLLQGTFTVNAVVWTIDAEKTRGEIWTA